MIRIGVFVCWCGSNIAATVDIEKVLAAAAKMPNVAYVADNKYMCSESGQLDIRETIRQENLTRVVIASCSPRMHENTFRKTLAAAGLNPYYLEVANVREQCSWVHKDKTPGTAKAIVLVKAAVAKVTLNAALTASSLEIEKKALVIGAGIAGIQAALDIADAGFPVEVVEREPSIGGRMSQLDKTFPTLDCSACILTPKMVDVSQHELITLHTYSEIEKVEGYVGNFTVTIRKKSRSVDMSKCTGCGICWEKCPAKVKSEFDENLTQRKAIYVPFPQAVPNIPVIDRENCIFFIKGKCRVCQKVCTVGAIDYTLEDEIITEKYGTIVVATGFDLLELDSYGEYGYGQHPDIITSLEFERLVNASGPTGGKIIKPSNGEEPQVVAFIQCVGSRDQAKGNPYCSKICCMYTAKHAILLREKIPTAKPVVFYIDVRSAGKDYEEFYNRTIDVYNATYIRGQVGKIYPDGDKLIVKGVDSLSAMPVELEVDMVVLAVSVSARKDAAELGRLLSISSNAYNFFNEAHPKLRPVETHAAGIYLAGMCQGPKDIPEVVAQAGAAAAKAVILLNKESLVGDPVIAAVEEALCSGCLECSRVCPYDAITEKILTERLGGKTISRQTVEVNSALCQGCGACTVTCRPGAINLKGFTNEQILAEVDAICL